MEAKKKKQNFFMRNIYYFIIAFVLLSAIAVTVFLILNNNESGVHVATSEDQAGIDSIGGNSSIGESIKPDDSSDDSSGKPTDGEDDGGGGTPVVKTVEFIIPVENSTIIKDYTAASVVYNSTLNIYTGHLAIDFKADEGAEVKAVYDGVVESVVTSYLTGTTITIKHDGDLKTVYNSVEPIDTLAEGKTVSQGQVIAYVSDNNKQEYKDGPHLHFEVYENGEKISPYKYLKSTEK